MVFKKIREHKEYIQDAASWFQAKWDIPQEEYLKSMNESLLKETSIPQWYIMLDKGVNHTIFLSFLITTHPLSFIGTIC
ncbi:hypothetical protein, partial [Phocaeicola dorei]